MPQSMMSLVMCTEALGINNGDSHVAEEEILPFDISQQERGLPHIREKRRLSEEPRQSLPPAMPWRGKRIVSERRDGRLIMTQVPTKRPFPLYASRMDGRLRLILMCPFDDAYEVCVGSNVKKDFGGHGNGSHGKKDCGSDESLKSGKWNLDGECSQMVG